MDELSQRRLRRSGASRPSAEQMARRHRHPCMLRPVVRSDHRGQLTLTAPPDRAFVVHEQADGSLLLVPQRRWSDGDGERSEVPA